MSKPLYLQRARNKFNMHENSTIYMPFSCTGVVHHLNGWSHTHTQHETQSRKGDDKIFSKQGGNKFH